MSGEGKRTATIVFEYPRDVAKALEAALKEEMTFRNLSEAEAWDCLIRTGMGLEGMAQTGIKVIGLYPDEIRGRRGRLPIIRGN